MAVVTLNEENFDKIIAENELVLVDFWALWCGPCRVFSEVYTALAQKYPDIVFGKVNIEKERTLAEDFKVGSIPLLVIFKAGIIVYAKPGALTEAALEEVIQKAKTLDIKEIQRDSILVPDTKGSA